MTLPDGVAGRGAEHGLLAGEDVVGPGEAALVQDPKRGLVSVMLSRDRRPGSTTCAGGRNITRSTSPTIVALAPMPSASVMATVKVKPGSRARERSGVTQILAQSAQPVVPAGAILAGAVDADQPVAGGGQVAEPPLGFGLRVGFAHARGAQLGQGVFEVKAELVVDFGGDVGAAFVEPEEPAEVVSRIMPASPQHSGHRARIAAPGVGVLAGAHADRPR